MDKKEIRKKVCEVIDENYGLSGEAVHDDDLLKDDLLMDSFDVFEMAIKLQKKLSIHISYEETFEMECMTVGELVDFLVNKYNG